MICWAARAKLHLSQKMQVASVKSDETPLMALMAPPFGALCEKRQSANDPALAPNKAAVDVEQTPELGGHILETVASDPDRWCWPHSTAMNTAEIDTFKARLAWFIDRGLILYDAECLAERMVIRDREKEERTVCLECIHLQRGGRCGNWQAAGVAIRARDAQLPVDLLVLLQRCAGYYPSVLNMVHMVGASTALASNIPKGQLK